MYAFSYQCEKYSQNKYYNDVDIFVSEYKPVTIIGDPAVALIGLWLKYFDYLLENKL